MTQRAPVTPAELEAALLRLAGQAASEARRTSSYSRRLKKEAAASAYRRGANMVRKAQSKRPPEPIKVPLRGYAVLVYDPAEWHHTVTLTPDTGDDARRFASKCCEEQEVAITPLADLEAVVEEARARQGRRAQSKRPPVASAELILAELRKAREAFPVLRVEDATNLAALDVHADLRDEAMEALLGVVDRLLARQP